MLEPEAQSQMVDSLVVGNELQLSKEEIKNLVSDLKLLHVHALTADGIAIVV